jgi:hypothetical protein
MTDRQPPNRIDTAQSRLMRKTLAARRALSKRLTPGPRRKQGTAADRSAHLRQPHD